MAGLGGSRPPPPFRLAGRDRKPVKAVLRKAMRWYVEPLAYDQRSFNAAALRLIDDLQAQIDELEQTARIRAGKPGRRMTLRTAAEMRVAWLSASCSVSPWPAGQIAMRIAVCRPQVPFAYGGAEIFSDTLVEQLRERGSRGGDRVDSVQVVSRHIACSPRRSCGGSST